MRSVRRIPFEKRWTRDTLEWVKWAPWHRYKDAGDRDGEVPEGVPLEEQEGEVGGNRGDKVVFIETRERPPKDFFITKADADKHGITRGCGGCRCCSWCSHRHLVSFFVGCSSRCIVGVDCD